MKPKIRLLLPYPPASGNHSHGTGRGRRWLKPIIRDYRDIVTAEVLRQGGRANMKGDLCMMMLINPPDRRRRDMDNVVKVVQDAMQQAGVYGDDCQICEKYVRRGEVVRDGGLVVVIERSGK